jgi:hypothetical protein
VYTLAWNNKLATKQTTPWSHPPSILPSSSAGHKSSKGICVLLVGVWERRTGGPGGACCSSLTTKPITPFPSLHVPSPGVRCRARARCVGLFCPKKVVWTCVLARARGAGARRPVSWRDVGGGRCRFGGLGIRLPSCGLSICWFETKTWKREDN